MQLKKLSNSDNSKTNITRIQKQKSNRVSRFPPIYKGTEEQSFKEGDKVKVNPVNRTGANIISTNSEYEVIKCWLSNLGDMSVWLIELKGDNLKNPYMAHHFHKV